MRDAGKVFRMGEVDVHALRHATLDVYTGEFLCILGPSGSGKSTLLNLLGGMDRATSGSVVFLGDELATKSDQQLTMYRRNEVGFVFQFYNLVPTLTALENVQVVTGIVPNPIDADRALEMVGLGSRAGHFPSQMSGGEQQRVAIARAVAGNPRLLLCDEPTGALDIETGKDVLRLLKHLNEELRKTVVVITHNTAITGMADRVATMRDGHVVSIHVNESPKSVEEIDL